MAENLALKENSLLAQAVKLENKKKLPASKKVQNPKSTERLYYQLINKLIRRAQDLFKQMVVPVGKDNPLTVDAKTKAQERMNSILNAIARWKKRVSEEVFTEKAIEEAVSQVAEDVNMRNTTQVKKSYDRITPIDLTGLITSGGIQKKQFIAENVDLITKVSQEIKTDVQRIVGERIPAGARWESIVGEVEKGLDGNAGVFKKLRTRAKLIARDQTNKLNGELTRARHEEIGFRLYRWSTAGDSRVRAEHQALDGEIFSWEGTVKINGKTFKPAPDGIIPGSEINCRCVAEPVYEV